MSKLKFLQSFIRSKTDTVYYHAKCRDGLLAAYGIHHYMSKHHPEQKIEYIGSGPWKDPLDVTDKNVVIVDMSFSLDKMKHMIKTANSLVILDHHETAMEALSEIDDKYKWFDMNHSGAYLSWKFFHREDDDKIPKLVKWVEAHDIWNQDYPQVKEFSAWWDQHYNIKKLPEDFHYYDKFLDNKYLSKQVNIFGPPLHRQLVAMVECCLNYASLKLYRIKGSIVHVASLNTTVLKSEIGNALMRKYPFIDMAMVYSYNDVSNVTSISMRSTNENMSTTIISKKFGGGGHRNASGFSLQGNHVKLPGMVLLDNNRFNNLLKLLYFTKETINGHIFNVVRLNTPFHQSKIGKYLLETLYDDVIRCNAIKYKHMILEGNKENKPHKKEELDKILKQHVDLAIIWNIDGSIGEVYSTIIPGKLNNEQLKALDDFFEQIRYGGVWKTTKLGFKT